MKILILAAAVLALSGCANVGGGLQSAGRAVCDNQFAARTALELALTQAGNIKDDRIRQDTVAALQVSLSALDLCPQQGTQP